MPDESSRSLATHSGRLLSAAGVSIATFTVSVWAVRTWPALQQANLLVAPISIALGLGLIIRWYRRDAYPIGLLYCVVMFFVLRWIYRLFGDRI